MLFGKFSVRKVTAHVFFPLIYIMELIQFTTIVFHLSLVVIVEQIKMF